MSVHKMGDIGGDDYEKFKKRQIDIMVGENKKRTSHVYDTIMNLPDRIEANNKSLVVDIEKFEARTRSNDILETTPKLEEWDANKLMGIIGENKNLWKNFSELDFLIKEGQIGDSIIDIGYINPESGRIIEEPKYSGTGKLNPEPLKEELAKSHEIVELIEQLQLLIENLKKDNSKIPEFISIFLLKLQNGLIIYESDVLEFKSMLEEESVKLFK